MTKRPVHIDIVSDIVCPWCIIGYKQLEHASRKAQISLLCRWHPFELNPDMAAEGENLRTHLAAKYGTTVEGSIAARARLTALGAELGFQFSYADDMMVYNTFRAHQLLHWAGSFGRQHDLKLALFKAFFTHRQNVDDPETLADAAAMAGLDRGEALAVLSDARYAEVVRVEEHRWIRQGVTGVPAMVFAGKYLVTGARGVDAYVSALQQVAAAEAA